MFFNSAIKEYLWIWPQLKKSRIPFIIIPHGELADGAQSKKHLKKMIGNYLFFNRFINNAEAIQCLSQNEFNNTHFGKKSLLRLMVLIFQMRKESKEWMILLY